MTDSSTQKLIYEIVRLRQAVREIIKVAHDPDYRPGDIARIANEALDRCPKMENEP